MLSGTIIRILEGWKHVWKSETYYDLACQFNVSKENLPRIIIHELQRKISLADAAMRSTSECAAQLHACFIGLVRGTGTQVPGRNRRPDPEGARLRDS